MSKTEIIKGEKFVTNFYTIASLKYSLLFFPTLVGNNETPTSNKQNPLKNVSSEISSLIDSL